MTAEELHNWGREYALKRRLSLVLKSPRIAYWRICGKEAQRTYMDLLKNKKMPPYILLNETVALYEKDIVKRMPHMTSRERRTKLSNLHRYAEGRF